MAVSLTDFVGRVAEFDCWNHAEKIRFFGWFIHAEKGQDRFNTKDIRECYNEVHLNPPNISQFLTQMEQRTPKEAMKDGRGYYLHRTIRERFDARYGKPLVETAPKTEPVLPNAVVANTRDYYVRIIQQANGCYEHGWFDACSVMIRKFVEILIIEVYEAHGSAQAVKDRNDNFLMLGDLVSTILKDTAWNLGREAKIHLPEIKSLGDRSAHNRRYVATKPDVDKVLDGLRVIADELLHLAKLK
jgi:hypothetical protein